MQLLENKVAVVTGSGQGIGEAIARKLAEHGARVIVTDINEQKGQAVADDLTAQGHEAAFRRFNVTDFEHIRENINAMRDIFGRIDIWVNNAGITGVARVEDITLEEWDRMQTLDIKSVFFCTQAVFEIMKQQNYGKLVHISSMAGERGGRSSSCAYSSAKAAVLNMSKCFALSGGKYNITSNCVCPGRTLTAMAQGLSWLTDPKDDPKLTIPLCRFGQPEDIANGVLFLASDLSSYVTGDTLDVNGGLYMK
ncbi:MAG: SDR family NAD(P)-dependent oxidoreductase [Eubacteriales bacterium]|nr:SDR family NAD(P)-dependent oxidoreductase [Eubacteriales bacterium]MDY4897950.1 SDR family NAD(P)-dependent oxidoreductase [Eubacteriales bacterium]